MKKVIITILSIFAFFYLIGEQESITASVIICKIISIVWLWLVIKANNYFCKGE